jgi:hypothetical protein
MNPFAPASRALIKGKGKVFPLQAWAGPWGFGRLRLLDFLDFRHYEGGKVVTHMHRPPLPPEVSWYSFLEAESTPGHLHYIKLKLPLMRL